MTLSAEPFHTIRELPEEVNKVKREFTHGKVIMLMSKDKSVAVSAALNLAHEISKLGVMYRSVDIVRMIQYWTLNKSEALKDYEGSLASPLLALYYLGKEFSQLYAASGYRSDELHNWINMRLSDRIRNNCATIIACREDVLGAKNRTTLFGSFGTLSDRFIMVNLRGGKESSE